MADAHAKRHDYHLVNPSPWPIVGSISAFVTGGRRDHLDATLVGRRRLIVFVLGVVGVLYTMFGWWRDVIREAESKATIPRWCRSGSATA